jgi:hypothetical protein
MKNTIKLALLMACLALLAFPGTALAKSLLDDRVIAGGTFTLETGEVQEGSLIVLGGAVTIEPGATVEGDVLVVGGTASIDGLVEGSVAGIGGVIDLSGAAVVEGDLSSLGATVNKDPDASVEGQIVTGVSLPNLILAPTEISIPGIPDFRPVFRPILDPVGRGIWSITRSLIWAALAAVIVIFVPNSIDRIARTAVKQPVVSGGVGCLTVLVAPIILIVMAITIILIPLSLLGVLILAVAWFIGRIALGLELGRRMGKLFDREWAAPLAAGGGTFVLSLIVDGVGSLVPCVGWILPAIVGVLALGSVILSRFGSQVYPPEDLGPVSRIQPSVARPPAQPNEPQEISATEASPEGSPTTSDSPE